MEKFSPSQLRSLSDKELVSQIVQNNEQVVEYLLFEKCSSMFNYIQTEIFSGKVGKFELINELYLYLSKNNWKIVQQFEGRSKLTTWLSVVAVRFFLKKKSEMIDSDKKVALNINSVKRIPCSYSQATMNEKMDLLSAIQKLNSPRDKFVIIAIELEGYEVEEVASQLNVTKANLYSIKKRALDKLAKILKEYRYART